MNGTHRRLIFAAMTILMAMLSMHGSMLAAVDTRSDLAQVVASVNQSRQPIYRALRRLEAGVPGSPRHGWLEVWTEQTPDRGFAFGVLSEGGNGYVRNKVLRNVLENEQQLIAAGHPLSAPLVPGNYTFNDRGADQMGMLKVGLTPLRKAYGLVDGSALIDAGASRLLRLEGRLVKSPSFWVRNVDIVWKYALVGGETLPTELSSTAKVRMFGSSTFRMQYRYETVSGRPVQ